ncbi:MAG: molecular chaperone HtpG [Ruminococcaceae bacterium]|nr:molecular chaperone HtpG [Oscillospiraceae bacterium]
MSESARFESGNISISAENMLPIIKKWLYSEKDIFIRELVSNCSDAISKHARLVSMAEAPYDDAPYRITVRVDPNAGTLSFDDNGIGMTADEVRKYINQVAFSGAKEFMEKYKDSEEESQIIGHFGLGFYSAFMCAKRVTIDTLSWQEGAEAVQWSSEGGSEYTLSESTRETRGTCVTIELDDESHEYTDRWAVREVLMKYFRFLPTPIYLEDASQELTTEEHPLNEVAPLWEKNPSDCTEEEYREFYHQVFMDTADPLFWVHLNIDYPFRLKGILYFPKLKNEFESAEGQVKLYCSRVFVADNIREVIPEYLLLLKGCIDCPDLPLNVSRSFLQNDGTVTRLSSHITRKVADRLLGLFKTDREHYNEYWDDINPFIKYACLRDEKFYDRVKPALIFKLLDGSYQTVDEYLTVPECDCGCEHENGECTCGHDHEHCDCGHDHENCECGHHHHDEPRKVVYYATDVNAQAQYISMFRANGIEAVLLQHVLDNHFITLLEHHNPGVKFRRIDSDLSELEKPDETAADAAVEALFSGFAVKAVRTARLAEGGAPAVLVLSEENRRMQEMARMFGGMDEVARMFPEERALVINRAHPLYEKLSALSAQNDDRAALLAAQIYDLARLAQEPFAADDMTAFLERSAKIMELL